MRKVLFILLAMTFAIPFTARAETWSGTNSQGQVFKMNFRSDGIVYGISTPLRGSNVIRDSGRWWNEGAKRCVQWNHWRHGRVRCGVKGGTWIYK